MKCLLTIASLLLLLNVGLAQFPLVNYNEVTFTSPFEKKVLDDHFLHKRTDPFMLFMANGGLLTESAIQQNKDRFYAHLKSFENEKFSTRKNDKKAKLIYDDIHHTFFQKFEPNSQFEEVFYTGFYNGVSASAVYALTFEKLSIPYAIKEDPSHVYLIAYPETERIVVETTTTIGVFMTLNQEFKQNYVKLLKDQKLISTQEFASKDLNTLFDKYYFGNQENISMLNLVGIQYMNDALQSIEAEKYAEAFTQLEKSYLFYPSDRCAYLLMVAGTQCLEKRKEKDSVHATYLSKLTRYKNFGVTSEMIQAEFGQVVIELLSTSGKKAQLDQYYQTLVATDMDEETKKGIEYIFNYESGRLLYNQARFKEAIPFFEAALKAKPENLDTNNALISAISQSLRAGIDNMEVLKMLEKYAAQYPSLQENNIFNSMLASLYVSQFGREYSLNKPVEGDKFKKLFEDYYQKFNSLTVESNLIGQSYSTAAVFYFRKGQVTKAKTIIAKGLEYAPNNYELLMRQQVIK